ncbi:MAG: MoaD family protein [Gemmatimonadetes bacterium]|nr:MoaD family protein [Gemmatimonadota bacterium]
MAVVVRIPTVLRPTTGNKDEIAAAPGTVGAVLEALGQQYPDFRNRITADSGKLRPYLNVFVNDEDIRFAKNLDTPVNDGDEISIIPSIAGGC